MVGVDADRAHVILAESAHVLAFLPMRRLSQHVGQEVKRFRVTRVHHTGKKRGSYCGRPARTLLRRHKIDVVYRKQDLVDGNLDNICYAINGHGGIHSLDYAKAVDDRLRAVVAMGKRAKKSDKAISGLLKQELENIRNDIENGINFWNK